MPERGQAMDAEDRIEWTRTVYARAVYNGDAAGMADAERALDAVEADLALARGRMLHGRFLIERTGGSSPVEDPAELPWFERAAELYRALGDVRGEAEALFWTGCLPQVVRIAQTQGAHAIVRQIEQARTAIQAPQ